jgi:hypothetical protein
LLSGVDGSALKQLLASSWKQLLASSWMATDGTGKVIVPKLPAAHNGDVGFRALARRRKWAMRRSFELWAQSLRLENSK